MDEPEFEYFEALENPRQRLQLKSLSELKRLSSAQGNYRIFVLKKEEIIEYFTMNGYWATEPIEEEGAA